MNKFVIAWKYNEQILYLTSNENGTVPTHDEKAAIRFSDYEAAYEEYLKWPDLLNEVDGAILTLDDVEAQFDPNRPSPRRPFNLTPEVVAAQLKIVELNDALEQERIAAKVKIDSAAAVIAEMRKGNAKAVAAAEAKVGAA